MKKSLIIGIIIVVVIAVIVFLSFNSINIIKSTQITDSDEYDYKSDGIILMHNVETGGYACFGCNNFLCVDPAPVMEPIEESDDRYCNNDFELIENGKVTEGKEEENKPAFGGLFGKQNCEGTKIKFDYLPVNLEKTKVFLPLGLMTGSHVTPIDHHYFQNFDNDKPDIEVYSPGNGFVMNIQHMPGAPEGKDYRIVIEHTCNISSIYIHIDILTQEIFEEIKDEDYASVKIPVEAGELIGWYSTNVDYNLVDEEVTLTGFLTPENYEGEPWKIHVPNTYDYFNEPVRSELIAKSLRTVDPISGKIDYDIDGRLVGNWFLEGTNGYRGGSEDYWLGHLAIAYDAYDPERIVFSIAGYEGKDSEQFAIKGNSPEPSSVGIEDGLVEYELVTYDYITSGGASWDRTSLVEGLTTKPNDVVVGVVLVEMIGDRRLKFEAFPGKSAGEVSEFTENARIYER